MTKGHSVTDLAIGARWKGVDVFGKFQYADE